MCCALKLSNKNPYSEKQYFVELTKIKCKDFV